MLWGNESSSIRAESASSAINFIFLMQRNVKLCSTFERVRCEEEEEINVGVIERHPWVVKWPIIGVQNR